MYLSNDETLHSRAARTAAAKLCELQLRCPSS